LRGFSEVQTWQVQPITGTPVEVPLPSMVTRSDMALGSLAAALCLGAGREGAASRKPAPFSRSREHRYPPNY
jgi:hypothetical protein